MSNHESENVAVSGVATEPNEVFTDKQLKLVEWIAADAAAFVARKAAEYAELAAREAQAAFLGEQEMVAANAR